MPRGIKIDWTNLEFYNCKIIEPLSINKRTGNDKWKIKCYCGKEFYTAPCDLKAGKVPSCGCNRSNLARTQMKKIEYYNYVNNHGVKLIKPVDINKQGSRQDWIALCPRDGIEFIIDPHSVIGNNTRSCGCLRSIQCRINVFKQLSQKRINKGLMANERITDKLVYIKSSTFDYVKHLVMKIDNFTCQLCNKNKCGAEVHHIDPVSKTINFKDVNSFKPLYDLNNLITLCRYCHMINAHNGSGRRINEKTQFILKEKTLFRKIKIEDLDEYNNIVQGKINNWINSYIQEINK